MYGPELFLFMCHMRLACDMGAAAVGCRTLFEERVKIYFPPDCAASGDPELGSTNASAGVVSPLPAQPRRSPLLEPAAVIWTLTWVRGWGQLARLARRKSFPRGCATRGLGLGGAQQDKQRACCI